MYNIMIARKWHLVMPRLVAVTSTGAMSDSSARLRKEKHSMSNM